MPQPGEIASPTSNRGTLLAVGILYLLTFFAILLAAGLEIQGLFQTRQERIESQVWPAVTAVVDGCALDHYSRSSRRSVTYKIRCGFTYSVNGTDYLSRTQTVGQRRTSFGDPDYLPPDAQQMEAWVEQHKKGSTMLIHYDPANPDNISLAGADNAFRTNTAAISLAAARQVAIAAALLLLASLAARKFTRPRTNP